MINLNQPLYILPFDHRSSFYSSLLGLKKPLNKKEKKLVADYKEIVFDGFKKIYQEYPNKKNLGILIDEEFGGKIIAECRKKKINFALATEKSGQEIFDFEYGSNFKKHLKKIKPTFAKALVRYNPANKKINAEQRKKLKALHSFCKKIKLPLIIELLIVPTKNEQTKYKKSFDAKIRPRLIVKTIGEFYQNGISPEIWKLEAMEKKSDWPKIIQTIKPNSKIIVLGRGESSAKVNRWLKIAAPFKTNLGFAVGRTVFFKPLKEYRDGKIKKVRAISLIAHNFGELIKLWEKYS
ncbi:MAG: DUF2090 domain-containing protein [Patescibacteria group bacterium]|nr:DUF2090 domain-containing protein [Patescibacteria group bacterium]MDD5490768.1 DUF2090 domain-containing protein [Patescibacteria group bacterium]